MSASATDIALVRDIIAEQGTDTFTDSDVSSAIERYPVVDADEYEPEDDDWTDTYDLYRAAGDLWQRKAALVVGNYDFSADNSRFNRSQVYAQYMNQARSCWSRAYAVGRSIVPLTPEGDEWVVN